jgi:MYXO-CTERM domain-containing protein
MRPVALFALSLLAWSGTSSAFTLDDPLTGSTKGQVFGGSLGPDGFTTTAGTDAIVWVVPALASGAVQFTVQGLTLDKLPAIDHEIFSMYDGFGLSEPVSYNPYFRSNNFKMLVRIYGQNEPSRTGQQKLLYSLCPLGPPGYGGDTPCPCPHYYNEEPFGGDDNWSGQPEVLRVEWTTTTARYLRNGVQILAVDWSATGTLWGPRQQHIMLGSPRNQLAPEVAMPLGVTFSNVHIEGTEGPATPACNAGTGGAAGAAGAAGAQGCSAELSAVSLSPEAGTGASAEFTAVYRYSGGADKLAMAQLWVGDQVAAGVPSVSVGMDPSTITFENQSCAPGESKVLQGAYGAVDCSKTGYTAAGTEATATWALRFQPATFAGKHGVFMDAKAQGEPQPRLCWTKMGEWNVPSASELDAGSGGSGGAAVDGSVAGKGGYAGYNYSGDGGDDGASCGCRSTGGRGRAPGLGAAALLLLLLRRRVERRKPRC